MHIFVTGATGFVGSAIVKELRSAGYQVTGLTRTAAGAQKLKSLGANVIVGKLDQLDLLREGAAKSDGVIHTAFIHGLPHMDLRMRLRLLTGALTQGMVSSFIRLLAETETRAVAALGSALAGSKRPLIVTSGILYLPFGKLASETDSHVKDQPNRSFSEQAALSFVSRGVSASIVRLPPTVHGKGDHGLIPQIIASARKRKTAAYVGDGSNRWPAVNRLDAATLFRLALEKSAVGSVYHGVAETGIPFREIAAKIGSKLNLPVSSCTPKEASKYFGFLSNFVGLDNPASSEWTQRTLGWTPQHPGLFADLETAGYFHGSAVANSADHSLDQTRELCG
jgi:nucleoside-diphosphate-sugar epimerase